MTESKGSESTTPDSTWSLLHGLENQRGHQNRNQDFREDTLQLELARTPTAGLQAAFQTLGDMKLSLQDPALEKQLRDLAVTMLNSQLPHRLRMYSNQIKGMREAMVRRYEEALDPHGGLDADAAKHALKLVANQLFTKNDLMCHVKQEVDRLIDIAGFSGIEARLREKLRDIRLKKHVAEAFTVRAQNLDSSESNLTSAAGLACAGLGFFGSGLLIALLPHVALFGGLAAGGCFSAAWWLNDDHLAQKEREAKMLGDFCRNAGVNLNHVKDKLAMLDETRTLLEDLLLQIDQMVTRKVSVQSMNANALLQFLGDQDLGHICDFLKHGSINGDAFVHVLEVGDFEELGVKDKLDLKRLARLQDRSRKGPIVAVSKQIQAVAQRVSTYLDDMVASLDLMIDLVTACQQSRWQWRNEL